MGGKRKFLLREIPRGHRLAEPGLIDLPSGVDIPYDKIQTGPELQRRLDQSRDSLLGSIDFVWQPDQGILGYYRTVEPDRVDFSKSPRDTLRRYENGRVSTVPHESLPENYGWYSLDQVWAFCLERRLRRSFVLDMVLWSHDRVINQGFSRRSRLTVSDYDTKFESWAMANPWPIEYS